MLGLLSTLAMVVAVSAVCSFPALSIPGVGTDLLCQHKDGCPKRAECSSHSLVSSFSAGSLALPQLLQGIVNCTVTCANGNNGNEFWRCVGEEVWERERGTPVLKCVAPALRPCPPFPPVVLGRCNAPVSLGYVLDRQLERCNQVKGCAADARLYAKGQLFQDLKACQTRLKVCLSQVPTKSPSSAPTRSLIERKNTSSSSLVNNNSSTLSNNSNVFVNVTSNVSVLLTNTTTVAVSSSVITTANATAAINNAISGALPLLGVLVPTPAPAVPPATKRAQEVVAKSLSGGASSSIPLAQGPWGGAGVDVDITMQELKKLNPTFDFQKTPEFEQYTNVVSDHFARLLYDSNNMLVRIVRQ